MTVGLAFGVVSQAEIWLTMAGPWRFVLAATAAVITVGIVWRRTRPTALQRWSCAA